MCADVYGSADVTGWLGLAQAGPFRLNYSALGTNLVGNIDIEGGK